MSIALPPKVKSYRPEPRPSKYEGKPALRCSDEYPVWFKLGAKLRVKTTPETNSRSRSSIARGIRCHSSNVLDMVLWGGEVGTVVERVREHDADYVASMGDHKCGWFCLVVDFERGRTFVPLNIHDFAKLAPVPKPRAKKSTSAQDCAACGHSDCPHCGVLSVRS